MTSPAAREPARLKILLLAEGNPDDSSASGSGTPASVGSALRRLGHTVLAADVELYGWRKLLALALTWSPNRRRWVAKYHLGPIPYAMRSRRATAAARRIRADVVLQYGGTFGVSPAVGVPCFLYCDSHTLLSHTEKNSWGAQMTAGQLAAAVQCQRNSYEAAAGIFTFSEYVRRSFLASYTLTPEQVTTVHAGPNFSIPPRPTRGLPASGHQPTVLFVGREFERKGGPQLLEAFRSVRTAIPNARLILIGPKTLAVNEAGVEYRGYLRKSEPDEARRLQESYESADVFCLPTRHEPFGIVVLEAMFHALPVVASNIWAIPEMVSEGETGYVVDRDDVAGMAAHLTALLGAPARALEMGNAGRLRAEQGFTWDIVVSRMLTRMRQVLSAPSR